MNREQSESEVSANAFTIASFQNLLAAALARGYEFITLADFFLGRHGKGPLFIIRHDLDDKPQRLANILRCEKEMGVRSSVFVLLRTTNYNIFSHALWRILKEAERDGFEIGLHSNFVETARILGENPDTILKQEVDCLRSMFSVRGIACHRTLDFMYNSLPYLQSNWARLRPLINLDYEAYDEGLMRRFIYVNEGFKTHLTWRNMKPEEAIATGGDVYLLTHPHWWHFRDIYEDYF